MNEYQQCVSVSVAPGKMGKQDFDESRLASNYSCIARDNETGERKQRVASYFLLKKEWKFG